MTATKQTVLFSKRHFHYLVIGKIQHNHQINQITHMQQLIIWFQQWQLNFKELFFFSLTNLEKDKQMTQFLSDYASQVWHKRQNQL